MKSPTKEGSDPNTGPAYGTRKRLSASPMSQSPAKRQQKRRMSMKNRRRVSFAPDPELTMVHTFEKDDDQSAGPSPLFAVVGRPVDTATGEPVHHSLTGHPALTNIPEVEPLPLGSPVEVAMDVTDTIQINHNPTGTMWMQQPLTGDVTAAVPSLGALAEADELLESEQQQQQYHDATHNITAAIPGLTALLEEDEAADGRRSDAGIERQQGRRLTEEGMDLTVAVGKVLENNTQQQQQLPNASPHTEASRLPSLSPGQLAEVQANKWGFVPGGDDTMDLNLEMHGRMIMGDHTYNRMYNDNTHTGNTTLGWGMNNNNNRNINTVAATANIDSPAQQQQMGQQPASTEKPASADQQQQQQNAIIPDWTAPAFLPPYMGGNTVNADHPALRRSPEMSESSLNTMSTRRVSVDARRQSVNSRRVSTMSFGGTAGLLNEEITPAGGNRRRSSLRSRASDVTDNLLRDDATEDFEGVEGAEGGFLAGLKQQMKMLSKGTSPAVMVGGDSFPTPTQHLPPVNEDEAFDEQQQQVGDATAPLGLMGANNNNHKTPFSVGDSSYGNGATGALLRTGGTTDLLADGVNVPGGANGEGAYTGATHGTTRLLRMDVTASSAINAKLLGSIDVGAESPALIEQPIGAYAEFNTGPLPSGLIPKFAPTPVPATLSASQQQQQEQMAQDPPSVQPHASMSHQYQHNVGQNQPASVHSQRSMSVFAPTPNTHRLANGRPSIGNQSVPGSAIAARYPGSAAAVHRLSHGFTPSVAPITFQDFAKLMDVQFLDNLRRGASINYADLQPNPTPSNLNESLRLLCVISPNVAELETAIHTLQTEGARLRSNSADMEAVLGQANPPIFRHVQIANAEQMEVFRSNVGLLKKVCRQKAVALLKDVRCQMEESKRRRLQRAFGALQADMALVQEFTSHMEGVSAAAQHYAEDLRVNMQEDVAARKQEAEQRQKLGAARAALEQQQAANAERHARLAATKERVEALRAERESLETERAQLATESEQLAAEVQRHAAAAAAVDGRDGAPPREVLEKLRSLDRLQTCLGWRLESATEDPVAAEAVFTVKELFKLKVSAAGKGGATCEAELVDNSSSILLSDKKKFAAALAGVAGSSSTMVTMPVAAMPAAVQALSWRVARAADVVTQELDGLRLACKPLSEITTLADGCIKLTFINLNAEVKFSATLRPSQAYPEGVLAVESHISYDGEGQITKQAIAAAVDSVPKASGRIRAACMALGDLALHAVKQPEVAPVVQASVVDMSPNNDGDDDTNNNNGSKERRQRRETIFSNPLFGKSGGAAEQFAFQV